MKLSLGDAAARMGKSVRQVRYMIQSGRLPAAKVGGRWLVDGADLPLSDGQQEALARRGRQAQAAVEEGLGLTESDREGRARYSVRDLKAFQIGLPLFRRAVGEMGVAHPAIPALRRMLERLAVGCHRFERSEKAACYGEARDAASLAVCELLLAPEGGGEELAGLIETELMAAMAGLMRRMTRRRGR